MSASNTELERLRRVEKKKFRAGDLDRDDLESALDEAGLLPYGSDGHVVVTISFRIGLEDEERPPRPMDLKAYREAIEETASDDGDWAIIDRRDGIEINISPIQRGNLPS